MKISLLPGIVYKCQLNVFSSLFQHQSFHFTQVDVKCYDVYKSPVTVSRIFLLLQVGITNQNKTWTWWALFQQPRTSMSCSDFGEVSSCPGASFHSVLSCANCCCFANGSLETSCRLSIAASVRESDPGGLHPPATFHLWQVRKWEWEREEGC